MLSFGVASSLVHEIGHQGAALLELVESLRGALHARRGEHPTAWRLWSHWISEIVADLWAIARIGVGSTLGLIALTSLPRGFVFRPSDDDPHPMPWVRVLLSCAIGDRLYPDRQWRQLAGTWRAMYPLAGVAPELQATIAELRATLPEFVTTLVEHRPPRLRGLSLAEALHNPQVHRTALLRRFESWDGNAERMERTPPTVAFAVIGQARASGQLAPGRESALLRRLIRVWAVRSSLATARATSEIEMFVGQPTIWEPAATRQEIGR
jgi:hypothetical protein